MTDSARTQYLPGEVSPPGTTLAELLEERGISQAELATRMGRPRKTISEIVNGKAAITLETAHQLELVTGVPADFWTARELKYRASLALMQEQARLAHELEWCTKFPLREMAKLSWIQGSKATTERVHELLSFLGVVSSEQWMQLYDEVAVAFRRAKAFESDKFALGAWLRRGLIEAQQTHSLPFDRERFRETLSAARGWTRDEPSRFVPALRGAFAKAGVAVVFVPSLPKSRACGATRWVTSEKAMIQLSLRYKTNDHLWFTFFHEAAHLLLHGRKLIFIEAGGDGESEEEAQADAWAANFLIPPVDFSELVAMEHWTTSNVRDFAARIGIAPGIVVGRLQHEGLVEHSQLNSLKVRYEWRADSEANQDNEDKH